MAVVLLLLGVGVLVRTMDGQEGNTRHRRSGHLSSSTPGYLHFCVDPVDDLVQAEHRGREHRELFLDQFLAPHPPPHWDFHTPARLGDVGEQEQEEDQGDATQHRQEQHALLPPPLLYRVPRDVSSIDNLAPPSAPAPASAPTPAPAPAPVPGAGDTLSSNLTVLMQQMREYVEDNMVNKVSRE